MKNSWLVVGLFQAAFLSQTSFGQNAIQFTSVKPNSDGGIQLYWASTSNEVYEIDYADAVADISEGGPVWQPLITDYPSHGTNTFVADTGNYHQTPSIPHPKTMPMRFYRVVDTGANSGEPPFVAITFPTANAVLSGEVTISVVTTSSYPIVLSRLYVDGQEMYNSTDGTNFTINTCEWANGQHTLFATSTAQSQDVGPAGYTALSIGRNVSSYVNVTFDNLIHKIAFSQPFFEPSLGQIQHVTADFAANSDWTLKILDQASNAVRTVTGSGPTLAFDWDGTGDRNVSIPDGVYMFSISAQPNGQPIIVAQPPGNGGGGLPPLSMALDASQSDSVDFPLPPLPPGFPYPTELSFTAPRTTRKLSSSVSIANSITPSVVARDGQTTTAPTKPPTKPVKNAVATVGVAYYDFTAWPTLTLPKNGLSGLPGNGSKVQLMGSYTKPQFGFLPGSALSGEMFSDELTKQGFKLAFNKSGNNLSVMDLKKASLGGNAIFGNVDIGYFSDHGSYGTSLDYNTYASQTYQIYFPSDNPVDVANPWIALSEFGLGNIRWLAIDACFSLRGQQFNSMNTRGVLPLGSANHLICGAETENKARPHFAMTWAQNMKPGLIFTTKVKDAWFTASKQIYSENPPSDGQTIQLRVGGWSNCFDDKINNYTPAPGGNITSEVQTVYP